MFFCIKFIKQFLNQRVVFSLFLLFSLSAAEANNKAQAEGNPPSMLGRVSRWIKQTDIAERIHFWIGDPNKRTDIIEPNYFVMRGISHWIGDIHRKKLKQQTKALIQRIVEREWENEAEKKEISSQFHIALGRDDNRHGKRAITSDILVELDPVSQNKVLQFIIELKDPELELSIARFLSERKSYEMRLLAAHFLGEIKPKTHQIHHLLADTAIDEISREIREVILKALIKIQPTDPSLFSQWIDRIAQEFETRKNPPPPKEVLVVLDYPQPKIERIVEFLAETLPSNIILSEQETDTLSQVLSEPDHDSRRYAAHILANNGPFKKALYFSLYEMGKKDTHRDTRFVAQQAAKTWMERALKASEEQNSDAKLALKEIREEQIMREKVNRDLYGSILSDPDPLKKGQAIAYFRSNPTGFSPLPSEIVTDLSHIASSEPNIYLKTQAIKALGKILAYETEERGRFNFHHLAQIAEEAENTEVTMAVIEVMGNIPNQSPFNAYVRTKLMDYLKSSTDKEIIRAALLSLAKVKPRTGEAVFQIAEFLKESELQATVLYVLRQIEPELFRITKDSEDLYSGMNEKEKLVARQAEEILGKEESRISLPFLAAYGSLPPDDTQNYERIISALKHPNSIVSFFAEKALEKIETSSAGRSNHPLIDHALSHQNALVRMTAIHHLNEQETIDPNELRSIAEGLKDPDPLVQFKAQDLLRSIEDRSSIQKQFEEDITNSEDQGVRANAEIALSFLRSLSSKDEVNYVEEDESKLEELFTQMENRLLQVEASEAQEVLDKLAAIENLLIFSTDKSNLDILIKSSIHHPSKETRDKAFDLISQLHNREEQVIAHLKEFLKHSDARISQEANLVLQRVKAAGGGTCLKWVQESIESKS